MRVLLAVFLACSLLAQKPKPGGSSGGGGGGAPGGSSGQVQVNVSGAFGGLAGTAANGDQGTIYELGVSYPSIMSLSKTATTGQAAAVSNRITYTAAAPLTSEGVMSGIFELINDGADVTNGVLPFSALFAYAEHRGAALGSIRGGVSWVNGGALASSQAAGIVMALDTAAWVDKGSSSQIIGLSSYIANYGASTVPEGIDVYMWADSSGTFTTRYGIYAQDFAGVATNPYYSWFDSRGVGRCKEDSRFDSVGQSICVVYNPQFTKYTPGAANYERLVYGQWNANVAEMGSEAGGTGTARPLRLLGSYVTAYSPIQTVETTVSGLGTCNSDAAGKHWAVSDSNAASFTVGIGAAVAGGGTTHVPVYCDGTNWRIG